MWPAANSVRGLLQGRRRAHRQENHEEDLRAPVKGWWRPTTSGGPPGGGGLRDSRGGGVIEAGGFGYGGEDGGRPPEMVAAADPSCQRPWGLGGIGDRGEKRFARAFAGNLHQLYGQIHTKR
jgi:hypothetical protein